MKNNSSQLTFPRRLTDLRLGEKHDKIDAFHHAVFQSEQSIRQSKEYTLIVVTETQTSSPEIVTDDAAPALNQRILLGMKNRGFGIGMYVSFGGKFHHAEETVEACACRELEEETNIKIQLNDMVRSKVGVQQYTFENDPVKMIMHVFRIDLKGKSYNVIGCDEITPQWYDDVNLIPFDNMFADDSLWLTTLLSSPIPLTINGSYHFQENCQHTNTIMHYYMDVQPKKNHFSLEQRLFHTLHENHNNILSIKEFKECYTFCNAVRTTFDKNSQKKDNFEIVIDVCGGHGALAALFLICTSANLAVVIDPANVGGGRIQKAWGSEFITNEKRLTYRRECLRAGLPEELEQALQIATRHRILVVACHACQHLSEEILDIACRYNVHVAVMPCCQKDRSPGSTWKASSKNLSIPVAKVMDLLQCGKIMALGTHDVRLKCIDSKITPQNRIIICRALTNIEISTFRRNRQAEVDKAHSKLELVYSKAHVVPGSKKYPSKNILKSQQSMLSSSLLCIAVGFVAGVMSSSALRKK
mmetsp:Transcript_20747/g.23289  ORF Transcript_20747/g.23289 Transcript_20747/m.23289 type:complete len:529 (+) Transcript_20747:33-1619(+)